MPDPSRNDPPPKPSVRRRVIFWTIVGVLLLTAGLVMELRHMLEHP